MMQSVRTIVAIVVVMPLLAAGAGGYSATVLCKGMDGHVSVEMAVGGACVAGPGTASASVEAPRHKAVPAIRHRGNHCGPCSDIPLEMGTAHKSDLYVQATKIEISGSVAETHTPAAFDAAEWHRPSFLPALTIGAGHTTLTCLRAVLLLI